MKGSLSICFTHALAPLCSCSVITKRHTRSGGPCSYSLSAAATSLPTQQLTICTSLLFLVLSSTHFWPATFLICLSSSSYSSTCHLSVCASSLPLGLVFCPVIYFFLFIALAFLLSLFFVFFLDGVILHSSSLQKNLIQHSKVGTFSITECSRRNVCLD